MDTSKVEKEISPGGGQMKAGATCLLAGRKADRLLKRWTGDISKLFLTQQDSCGQSRYPFSKQEQTDTRTDT